MPTAVALFSGGSDSATACVHLVEDGWRVWPLFIDYGQRARAAERRAAKALLGELPTEPLITIRLGDLGRVLGFGLMSDPADDGQFDEYVPHRNLLLGAVGAMYSEKIHGSAVVFGTWGDDRAGYPDTTPDFMSRLETVVRKSADVRVFSPFSGWSKREVVAYGTSRGLDYGRTWSCNSSSTLHCGVCSSCVERSIFVDGNADVRTQFRVAQS